MKTLKLLSPDPNFMGSIRNDNSYAPSGIQFAFCSEPTKANTVKLRSQLVGCRDQLCCQIETKFYGKAYSSIPIRKTRLVVMGPEKKVLTEQVIKKTLLFLNLLEKKHKWTPSVVRKVDFSECKAINNRAKSSLAMYAFFSGPRWIRSSHMISLYSLIIRACIYNEEIRNIQTFKKFQEKDFSLMNRKDGHYIRMVFPKITSIMANYNKLFKDLPIKANYTEKIRGSGGMPQRTYGEGIQRLCQGSSRHTTLQKRFKALS